MKKFLIGLFAAITFIPSLIYLASCLTPYISPVHFWPMAFLALGFPYLSLVILALALLWFFIRKKVALFLLLLFFAGYKNLFSTFALDLPVKSPPTKYPGSLRILTWNVRGFDNPAIGADSAGSIHKRMFNYIDSVKPDILCLQEFAEHYFPGAVSNTAELKKLGYTYSYKTNEVVHTFPYGKLLSGTAIFSRVPIIDSQKVMLGDPSYCEYIASVDVLLKNKRLRVFATHLKSINLFAHPEDSLNRVTLYGDSGFVYHSTKFQKLKAFAQAHAREAVIAKDVLNKSPYPAILGVDMNSVPTSYPYHVLSANLQDAFKLNGWGLGTTIDSLPKTLRIDFLLADKKLSITNFKKDELHLSDHFPQYIDVWWKN